VVLSFGDKYTELFLEYILLMKWIKSFNESDEWNDPVYHTSEINKDDIEDLEDHFIDVKDEWLMAPSKWLSNPLTAPNNFNFRDCKFYYHFYLPFNDKLAMMKVGGKSKNVVEFSIESHSAVSADGLTRDEYYRKLDEVKEKLLGDIERFLVEIKHLGWQVWDWSESRKNFINKGGHWSNRLDIYLYK
jgi:hypothetical protein